MRAGQELIIDPTGFEAILTDQCWTDHICRSHPEMEPFRHLVRETIELPDAIHLGKRDPSRRVYAKRYPNVPGVGNWLVMLVFVGGADRHVATGYFAAHVIRALGQEIWRSSSARP